MSQQDELYVLARRVLLDALQALGEHRAAIVLVGAQAVYLRVGEADLAVAPFTTDGDLAIDPGLLAEIPPLEQGLIEAGFRPQLQAGAFKRGESTLLELEELRRQGVTPQPTAL